MQVAEWLKTQGLAEIAPLVKYHKVDGLCLLGNPPSILPPPAHNPYHRHTAANSPLAHWDLFDSQPLAAYRNAGLTPFGLFGGTCFCCYHDARAT